MANKPKPPSVEFFTPPGEFIFPSLVAPSTKFPKKGVDAWYECTTRFSPDTFDPAVMEQLVVLRDQHAEKVKAAYLANGNGAAAKKVHTVDIFTQDIVKATGEPTGLVKVGAKRGAYGTKKDGTPWKLPPPDVFDAAGNPVPPGISIWGGSVGIVKVQATAYDMPTGVVGVKFQLLAAQVLKLVNSRQPLSASQHGFQAQKGFVSTTTINTQEANEGSTSREPGSDDDQQNDDDIPY